MDSELVFGADCVIRLEDLGEFKDYTDTIDALIDKIAQLKSKKQPIFSSQLLQVIQADPEDTFFLPSFKQLLNLIADQNWLSYKLKQNEIKSLLKFEIAIIEESLLSFTFGEQIVKGMIEKFQKYINFAAFQKILLNSLFQLSQKVVYLDDQDALITLFEYIYQENLFDAVHPDLNNINVAVYLQICQKLLRSHHIRQKINKRSIKDKPIFQSKMSLWNKDISTYKACLKQIQDNKYFNSSFLQKTLKHWSKNIEK